MGFLALTRKPKEETILILPDGRRITVLAEPKPRSDAIKLMIDAPSDIRIVRAELLGRPPEEAA